MHNPYLLTRKVDRYTIQVGKPQKNNCMSIAQTLSAIGLDAKQQKVYLTLLKLGDAPAAMIAKRVGLPRTTTYHNLESLVKDGLASTYKSGGVTRFAAESVHKIKSVLEGKIALVDKYLPELEKISSAERIIDLRLFEGDNGMLQIVEEELASREKIVRSIGSAKDLRKGMSGRITFTSRRVEKKIFSRCLRPQNDEFSPGWLEDQEKELRSVRLLPENIRAEGMTFIYDNKVAVIAPEEEGLGFIVTSKTFSNTMKHIFDTLWDLSQKT